MKEQGYPTVVNTPEKWRKAAAGQRERMHKPLLTVIEGGLLLSAKERLATIRDEQITTLVRRGFPLALGVDEDTYRASFPEIALTERAIQDAFPLPLLVDPRLTALEQIRLFAIENDFEPAVTANAVINADGIKTPTTPYLIWVQSGRKYRGLTLSELKGKISPQERGLTLFEGFALYAQYPEEFFHERPHYKLHGVSLAGSLAPHNHTPFLEHYFYDIYSEDTTGDVEVYPTTNSQENETGGWPTCALLEAA